MSRCACNRRWRNKREDPTHCCRASVLLSVLVCAALLPGRGGAEEARATTGMPPPARGADLNHDPFLGALSLSSSREPVSITAAALEFDYRSRVLTYKGEVV